LLVLGRVPHGEHHRQRFRQEPPRHETEHLRRSPVEPLRVIHHTDQRPLLRYLRHQAQHSQTDQKAVRRRTGAEAEGSPKRIALRTRQFVQVGEHRCAELMQAGKGELHLGLDAGRPRDAASRRTPPQVPQQRRLSDARFTPEDQDSTLPAPHVLQQPIKGFALAVPAAQFLRTMKLGHLPRFFDSDSGSLPRITLVVKFVRTGGQPG
jgi:hypothetical protein